MDPVNSFAARGAEIFLVQNMHPMVKLASIGILYKYRRRTSATRSVTANVLQTKVDAQCDKLATELS